MFITPLSTPIKQTDRVERVGQKQPNSDFSITEEREKRTSAVYQKIRKQDDREERAESLLPYLDQLPLDQILELLES